ncbi:MAG: sulfite exporter TauE/SafE family protein [Bacteroidetes bacterium]|jgi:uncharacterized protein|nr:MAG: sulfite exporter TauE/SafE family protein [Bacteroidota bacterium]TAE67314.1 MAG: sulfite exporter TauE/SafE family protein [Bacteroidota bacterium]TAF88961.1 MAG: sulfite exporter TauE/SafE family protein [Bacteroidota bacterium]
METNTILLLLLLGFAAGLLSGLVGIGGGIILVPALIYFLGTNQKTAQGTTLLILMLPVGILAVLNYYKQGYVNYKFSFLLAAGFVLGGYFGSKLSLALPDAILKKVFAGVLLLIALKMMFFDGGTTTKKESSNKVLSK